MIKRMLLMLILVGILFGGIFGYHAFGNYMMKKYMFSGEVPPVTVSAIKAQLLPWQSELKAIGNIRAIQGVDVTTEIPGMVQGVFFKSGDKVKKGQVLVRLNADTDIAQLRSLEAAAQLAQTIYRRDKKQFEVQAISKAVVDADASELKTRRALVSQQIAVIAKKIIRAPFTGQLGISTLTQGQYLNPGEKIVTLQSLDSVFVDFFLPQQELSRVAVAQKIDITTDTYPGQIFTGKITAINPKVDSDSRNVLIEAEIPNPQHELVPGMYASVAVQAGDMGYYVTIPQTSISFNPYGETIYVIHESEKDAKGKTALTAKQIFITTGEARGDQQAVLKGIKQGDMVVTSGQMKLKNGSPVIINNDIQPSNDAAPKPIDQ